MDALGHVNNCLRQAAMLVLQLCAQSTSAHVFFCLVACPMPESPACMKICRPVELLKTRGLIHRRPSETGCGCSSLSERALLLGWAPPA